MTIVSCDNLPGNGSFGRAALTGFARLRDPELASWIEAEVEFPNSMVDRITPVTTDEDRAQVSVRFGSEERLCGYTYAHEATASWARYAEGTDEQGQPMETVDRRRVENARGDQRASV